MNRSLNIVNNIVKICKTHTANVTKIALLTTSGLNRLVRTGEGARARRLACAQHGQAGEQGVPPPVERGEARPVAVQHDKGCFYTCHGPFNHLPLQTSRPPRRLFFSAAARLGPMFNVEVLNLTVSSIKKIIRVDRWLGRWKQWTQLLISSDWFRLGVTHTFPVRLSRMDLIRCLDGF